MARYYIIDNEYAANGVISETTSTGRKMTEEEIINFLASYYGAEVRLVDEEESKRNYGPYGGWTDEEILGDAPKYMGGPERAYLEESGLNYPDAEDVDPHDRWYSGRQPIINPAATWPVRMPAEEQTLPRPKLRPRRQPAWETE